MADAAAARREARRRRILENSHNRLQLISGKCGGDESPRDSPVRTAVIPDHSHDSLPSLDSGLYDKPPLSNGVIFSESESFDLLPLNHDVAAGDGEIPSELASFTSLQEPAPTPLWEKIAANRYDVVLLSLVIQLMYCMSLVAFDGTYFFLPLLIYDLTKLIWFPSQCNSKFDSMLQLVNGLSSGRVQYVIYFTQCLNVISRDVCVFLFTTICIQALFITLNGLIT